MGGVRKVIEGINDNDKVAQKYLRKSVGLEEMLISEDYRKIYETEIDSAEDLSNV